MGRPKGSTNKPKQEAQAQATEPEFKPEVIEDIVMEEIETDSRTLRSSQERDDEQREMPWKPSRLLPTPHPIDGYTFRYVRVASGGSIDNMNHSQALRDGWVPVKAEECPELGVVVSDIGTDDGNVVLGGMMLCKIPNKIFNQMQDRASEESRSQVEGVDRGYLNDQNSAMRKFSEKESRVQFGGNK
jgi:hypothetical protein